MDDSDTDWMLFTTPMLTPNVSESDTSNYFDPECSFSCSDYQQQTLNLTRDLQEAAARCCQLDTTESEADIQDQQPTEATDDSDESSHIQATTVNIIDDSFHLQKRDSVILPTVQEIEHVEDTSSTTMSDTERIPIDEQHKRPVLNYSLSLCVPYTDEDDDISTVNDTSTMTSSISSEFTGMDEKDEIKPRHIVISYNHSTRVICSKIAKCLKNRNYIVWIDQDNISGDVYTSMASAIENSYVVLLAINEQYCESRFCRLEAEYSVEQNIAYIPLLMQSGYKPTGWLGIISGSKLHIDFSQLPFDQALTLLIREIEAVRISSGMTKIDSNSSMPVHNQMTTTTDNSWLHLQNVHDWTADDVIEWLFREKLQIFENALRHFTGATLWQLYKIKFDSAPDYYRTVETLLPPTNPLRLVSNLTLHSALDALFSSSIHSIHR